MGTVTNFYLFQPAMNVYHVYGYGEILAEDETDLKEKLQYRLDKNICAIGSSYQMGKTILVGGMNTRKDGTTQTYTIESNMKERIAMMQKDVEALDNETYGHLPKKERHVELYPVRSEPKIPRNSPCPCGSGKKYKHCCINK
jgi:hypothetical protein